MSLRLAVWFVLLWVAVPVAAHEPPPESLLGEAARVQIGSLVLEGVPVLVAPRGHYNWAGPDDSILGYDVLQEFTIRLDFQNGRAWLKRRSDAQRTLLGDDWEQVRDERRGVAATPAATPEP
jgi:hypothetical protein